ncbi:MAG: class I mannose-6-phosphate isomerase [Dysgonamonadaceae bacterium]|jgi:mannose-6-phosphate isomerase|nr:class I mannose-6-phosphate isomerase [Dysgonamonadaceae bacterium]
MYPLKFKPILKETIWGGSKICRLKGIEPVLENIGESWEISAIEGNTSIVANGADANKSLSELIDIHAGKLLGEKVIRSFGRKFPLLVKFIDAHQSLSIQVHPNDELAKRRHNAFGKTEMWYVIEADAGACLYAGFSKDITPDLYIKSVAEGTVTEYLQRYEVSAGDTFFLPAGTVHAICAGCLIVEIQQTSDITYRIFDYNRLDSGGNPRELHTGLAIDAIDYHSYESCKVDYVPKANEFQTLVKCPSFTVQVIESGEHIIPPDVGDSFTIYTTIEGNAVLIDSNGNTTNLNMGETALIPAALKIDVIRFTSNGKMIIINP